MNKMIWKRGTRKTIDLQLFICHHNFVFEFMKIKMFLFSKMQLLSKETNSFIANSVAFIYNYKADYY